MGVLVKNIANDKPRRPFRLVRESPSHCRRDCVHSRWGRSAAFRGKNWDTFVNRFVEDYLVTHPDVAVRAGRHEFDGKLPDWSPAALKKQGDWLRSSS